MPEILVLPYCTPVFLNLFKYIHDNSLSKNFHKITDKEFYHYTYLYLISDYYREVLLPLRGTSSLCFLSHMGITVPSSSFPFSFFLFPLKVPSHNKSIIISFLCLK